jgi:hypothetical protein
MAQFLQVIFSANLMNVRYTRRKKCHHPAQEMSSPGARNVITRLVRVIPRHKPGSKGLYKGVITGLPEQVGQ